MTTPSFKARTFRLNAGHQYSDQLFTRSLSTIATPLTAGQTDSIRAAYLPDGDAAIPTIFGKLSWTAPMEESPSQCSVQLFDGEGMVTGVLFEPTRTVFNGDCQVSGTLSASSLEGQLTTADQPGVTSLGTLTGLTVDGGVYLPSLSYVPSAGTMLTVDSSTGEILYTPVSGAFETIDTLPVLTITENLLLPNAPIFRPSYSLYIEPVTGTVFKALTPYTVTETADGIESVTFGANVLASSLTVSGNVSATGRLVGTLGTAAQPNITSVGVLQGLTVAGNTTINSLAVTNTVTANAFRGNVGTLTTLNVRGNITAGNISSNVATLTSLSVSGNVSVGNLASSGAVKAADWVELGQDPNRWRMTPDDIDGTLVTQKWESGAWVTKSSSGDIPSELQVASGSDTWRIAPDLVTQALAIQRYEAGVWVTKSLIGGII